MVGQKNNQSSLVNILAATPDIIQLVKWCHLKSKDFRKARISPGEFLINGTDYTYRGICALKRIPTGKEIMFVPESCLITSRELTHCQNIFKMDELSLHEKFTLFILKENFKYVSEYCSYLNSLPVDFSNHHPGYLPEKEVKMLPLSFSDLISKQQGQVKSGFKKSIKYLSNSIELQNLSESEIFEKYRWAWYVVNTRTVFFMNRQEDGQRNKEMALAPYLDLFNHAPEPNTKVTYLEGKGYSITSTKDILTMEQIFISYGPHSNYKLWSEYGFIPLQKNPFKCIPFEINKYSSIGPSPSNKLHFENQCLANVLTDKRKLVIVNQSELLKELFFLENELSPNFELLITAEVWDPTIEKFGFNVNKKSKQFLRIVKEIISNEQEATLKSLEYFERCSQKNGVSDGTCQFLRDCAALYQRIYDAYITCD